MIAGGSIGALLAWHLKQHTAHRVTLLLSASLHNRRELSRQRQGLGQAGKLSTGITLEREGSLSHAWGFEPELVGAATSIRSQDARRSAMRTPAEPLASSAPISALCLAVKSHEAVGALTAIRDRLSAQSTVLLCQNGMGVLDQLCEETFADRSQRPSFVIAVNSHGAMRKRQYPDLAVAWTGVGELAFGIVPSEQVSDSAADVDRPASALPNALLTGSGPIRLERDLPDRPANASLRMMVDSLLACEPLRPRLLPLDVLQERQVQKLVVNCIINPLTALLDVRNGALYGSPDTDALATAIATEASTCFFAQLHGQREGLEPRPFAPGHPLSPEVLVSLSISVMRNTAGNVSSMLGDVRSAGTTEMCVLSGAASDAAQRVHQRLCLASRPPVQGSHAGQRLAGPARPSAHRPGSRRRDRPGANEFRIALTL